MTEFEPELIHNNERYKVEDTNFKFFTMSRTLLHPNQSTRGHSHPWPEIYVCTDGEGILILENPDEILDIKKGDLHKISSNRFHKVETIDGIEFHCFFQGVREH
ncbi:MAG: hypothetical protein CL792_01915 [Chloroflexi bacterium]|nr:hypothetical protein [Chloroflexota bacterium]|tara:strand:+ start:13329 stop:13640 length:312 start_codon:yes stop_codon:yes gene_type:complete